MYWLLLIFESSLVIFVSVLFTSLIYILSVKNYGGRIKKLVLISTLILAALQYQTNLPHDNSMDKAMQIDRLNSYAISDSKINNFLVSSKIAYHLDGRKESLLIYSIQNNLRNALDLNYYFFGSYPRELQTPGEFRKFSFLWLPFFLIGLYFVAKNKHFLMKVFLASIVLIAIIGDKNHLGVFVMLPFIIATIYVGLINIHEKYF